MHTKTNPQMGLLDSLMATVPANHFLERLEVIIDWKPIEEALHKMYPAKTGRPPCAPLVLFKMSLLQHCYNLSDPQCEEQVSDRLSWRSFVGLGLQDAVPDETTLVRFRQRLQEYRLHESMLELINKQLEAKGLILKTCTLVDATLLDAARRAPSKNGSAGGDPDASYTVKRGEPHYGYKAHIAVDQEHNLIRNVSMTGAHVHDSVEFEHVVKGDERMVIADKAYWGRKRDEWCEQNGVVNGIIQKAVRGKKLRESFQRLNRALSSVRCQIEQIFGWWKRSVGYWRVRYLGRKANRLELEFKSICWNLKRTVNLVSE